MIKGYKAFEKKTLYPFYCIKNKNPVILGDKYNRKCLVLIIK